MGFSLGLAIYNGLSEGWTNRANRILDRRLSDGKEDEQRIDERRGVPSAARPAGKLIWFHAASVGEALSIQELVRRLGEEREDLNFLITTGTRASADILHERLPPRALHQYIPLDVGPFVRQFLDHWQIDLAIWTESEFWPKLMVETSKRGIPMLLVNARISKKSHDRWRWIPGFAKALLRRFDYILAQDPRTGERLVRLGYARNLIEVGGTLKEGTAALACDEAERDHIASKFEARPVWLAASTHPGEEQIVVNAHRHAIRLSHRLLLIIVPRHPNRGADIAAHLAADGWKVALRSAGDEIAPDTQIYLADTLGELGLWYRLAPISFVGGSLVKIGGHNPFEPAALGSAIIHGPHVANFADIFARLSEAGAARCVTNEHMLAETVEELLSPDRAADMAHAAWEVCSSGAEVTDRAVELIFEHLDRAA